MNMKDYNEYKIEVVIDVMRKFAETEDYFVSVLQEYFNADEDSRENMNRMLIDIFDEHEESGVSIETLVLFACYSD